MSALSALTSISSVRRRTGSIVLLATSALTCPFLAATAAAQVPTGGTVAAGSAAISQPNATQLNITQTSQSAVVNWQSFSVGQGSTVNIAQPNSSSALLNRVTSNATSTIAGQINANGQVYLVNPNGIAITKSGVVNTGGGFVASTLGISDADFQSGKRTFTGNGASAGVSNAGAINVGRGGYAALIGGTVSNSGSINVPLGKVGLGSGEKATLDFSGDGFLQVAMPTSAGGKGALIKNSGSIKADGGSVTISAATAREAARNAVNISGVVQARSIGGRSGAIIIGGGGGGRVKITGRLDASSRRHSGGAVQVTGQSIKLKSATVDASGKTGGGTINVGGGRQGSGPLQHADTTTVDANTLIRAGATQSGNGGNVVIWSDQRTTFAGGINAQGGATSGNGGEVEVSSHGLLEYKGFTSLSAAHGTFGTLLLDPADVIIKSNGGVNSNDTLSAGTFSPNSGAAASIVDTGLLQTALASANVTVTTTNSGTSGGGAGNITVSDPVSWTSGNTLTLNAAGNIAINGAISGQGGNYGGFLTLQVGAGKSITQTQSIYAGLVTVIGSGAQVTLTNTGNSFFNIAGNLGTGVGSSVSIYNQSGYYIWSNAATSTYGLTADTVRLATDFGTIGQQNSQPGDPANKITTGTGGLILAGTTNSTFNLNNEANVISRLSAVGRDITVFTSSPTLTVGNFGGVNGITSGGTNAFGRLSLQADKYVFQAPVSAATSIQLASNTHNLAMEIGGVTATPGFTGVTILASDLAQFSTPAVIFGRNDSLSTYDPVTFITTYTSYGPSSITLKGPITTASLAGGGPQAGQTFNSLSLYAAGNISQDSGAIINLGAANPNGQTQLVAQIGSGATGNIKLDQQNAVGTASLNGVGDVSFTNTIDVNFSGGGTNVLLTQIGYHKFSSNNVYASNSLALRDDGVHGADFELGGFNTLGRNGVPEPVHNQPTWIPGTLAVSLTRGTNSILKFGASGFGGQADYNIGSATINGITVSGLKADTVTLGTSTYFQQTNFDLNDLQHYGAGITVPDTVSQSAGAAGAINAGTLNLLGVQFGTPGFSNDTFNAGNFQLNNPLNQVGTLAGRSNNTPGAIGTISYAQSTALQLGNIAANRVVLSAGGAVTQLGGTTLVAQNAGLLLSGSGQYTLLNTGNAVSLLAANLGTGNGSFIKLNTSTTTISTVNGISGVSADLVALNTPSLTTQAANAPIVTGALALTGTGSSFTFNNTSNQIGSIAAITGNLSVVAGTGALTVATVNGVAGINSTGNVSLFADQQIAATAPLHAGGTLTLANMTAGTAIDIGGISVVPGHLTIRAADLKQISNSSLTIGRNDAAASGQITIAGNIDGSSVATGTTLSSLTLLTGAGVGEGSNTIGVNTLTINAASAIVLDQANTVSTLSANAGSGNVTFANVGGFNIAGGITGNAVSLTSGGTITQTSGAPILASSLELHDRGGGADFELTEATNQLGATAAPGTLAAALTRSANSVVRFADNGNGYVVGTVNTTTGITADTVALGSTGVVTQTGGISASALVLSGAGGQFTLQGSNVVSALSANLGTSNGSLVNFTNGVTGPFALGNLQADTVTLSLNGVTAVTQQAGTSIVTGGAFSVTSQGGNYQLTNAGNQIGALSANIGTGNGSFFAYNDSGAGYTLTGVTADTVALGATGIVTATGAVVTGAGGLALTGVGGDFTLINDLNVVSKLAANTGSLRVASGTVPSFSVSAVNGITGVTATGDVTLYSDRPVTLSSPMSAGGTITLANQTAGVPIDIGGTVAVPGHFTLLAVDLKQIVASGLGVGRNDANASGAITILSNLNANSLADGSTLGTLNLLTGAGVTQGNNTINVNKVSVAAGGAVVLDQANTVGVFSANAGNNPVTFVSTSGFNVATGITGSAVSLTAGGAVTQSAGASVKATTLVLRDRGAGAAFELTDPTNQLGVTGTPGTFAASLTRGTSSVAGFAGNGNGFVVGTVDGVIGVNADTVKLGSSAGPVTQTAAVNTGTLALSGAGGQFTLNNAGNVANTFSATLGTANGSSVAFTDSVTTPVSLGNLQADTVSLNLGAGSSTSQQAGTSIVVGGTFSLTGSGGTHQLTNAGNQAGALAVSIGTGNGSSFAFSDSGTGFVVSGVTADTVALASGGTVTQTGAIVTGTGANTGLALTGGGVFGLNSASNQVSTLAASADQLYFANPGSYNVGSVGGVSGITSRVVELSSSGTVTQSSDINIDGSGASLSFVGGNYQFASAGNVINAPIIGSAGTAAISSVSPKITIGSAGLSATGTTTLYGKGFQFDGYVNSPNGITIANATPANLFIGNNLSGIPSDFLNIPGNVFLFDNFGALSRLVTNSLTFGRNDANATSNLIIGNDFNISTLTLLSGGPINTLNSLITTNRLNAAAGGDILVNAGSTIKGLGNITGATVNLGSTVALTQIAGTALNVDSLILVSTPSAILNNATNRIGALAANFGTGSGHSLSVTSTGTVNSAGAIVVSDLKLSGSGTKYFLTNPGNQIPTFSANLGTGNGSALSLADTGTVGQSGAIVTDALSLSGAGQYTLTNGGNQIGSLAANLGVGNGSLLDIFSNGSVGSGGAVVVSNLVLRGGNFTLDDPGGAVSTLAVNAGSVNVWGGGSTTIGTLNGITGINSSGNFALSADTPVLANNINAAGTVTLANASPGRQFTVGDGASGTSINITQTEYNKIHAGALVLGRNDAFAAGQITIKGALAKGSGPGSLTLITGAGVGQQQSNTLFVTLQSLSVIANGDVGLAGSYNQLGVFSATTSGNVSLRDSSSTPLVIAGVTANSLTITAPQTVVKQSAPIRVNTLTLSTLGAFYGEFALDSESNQLGTAANPGTLNTDLILDAVNVPGFVYFADNGTGFKLGSTKAGYLDLYTTGTVTQSGNLNVLNLQLNGVGGNYQLTSGGNSIQGRIAANTGTVNIFNASGSGISTGSLSPGANAQHVGGVSGIAATGSVKIVTAGSFNVLGGSPITSQATGDAVVISAGSNFATNFINQSGAGGITTPNGRFLIFTNTVGGVSAGGLTASPLYGTSYANYAANGIANAGNRFVYAQTKTVTVTPTTNAGTILYDGQQHTLSNFTYSGLVAGDDPALALSGTPVTTAARNAGTNTVTATAGSLTSDYGYSLAFGTGTIAITPAPLTVSAVGGSKVYDGTTASTITPTIVSGQLYGTDSLTEVFASRNVLGTGASVLTVPGVANDGNGGGNYTLTVNTPTAAGTITPAPLTVTAATVSRAYDGTTGTTVAPLVTSGTVFSGDTANFSEAFTSKNVRGTGGSTLVASGSVLDGNNGGNYAVTFQDAAGTITAAPLTVSAATATKGYDGTTGTSSAPLVTSGTVFSGDTANFSEAFASKNVFGANGSTLVASGSVSDGNGGNNYAVTFQNAAGTITAAPLTVTATTATKVYDGTTGTTSAPLVTSGTVFSGDTANFSEAFALKNVLGANGSTLVASGSVSDSNGGNNYAVTFQSVAGTITAAPLTVSAATATKVYDGTTGTTSAPQVTSGTVFSGDTANFSEVFTSKNVLGANGSTLVASGSVSDSNGGNNYAITFQGATGTITAAPLTVSATTAARFYDGTTGTTSAPQVTSGTVFSGDTANFSESFASKNVQGANGSALVASGSVADSNGGGNYAVTFQTAAGTITAASLTVSATSATKVYDGTMGTTSAPLVTSGTVFSGDTANFSEAFASKNVQGANGSTLAASGSVADGNGGSNYAVTFQTATGTITAAALTVSATTATKVFDNTTSTTSTPQVTSGTVFGGDAANFSQAFASKNALGVAGSMLVATGSVNDGNGGNNYAVTFQTAAGTITRAPLTVTGLAGQDIIYNNSIVDPLSGTAALSGTTYGNVALTGSPTGAFADPNVGINKPVTVSGLSLTGSEAGNYVLNVPTLSASIGAAALAVTVTGLTAHDIVYNGGTVDPITGTPVLTGMTFGNVALTGSAVGTFADPNVGTNKSVTVSGLSLTGTGAANYILTQPALTASITRAPLAVTANALSRLYGDVNPASGAATGNNLQGSDTISAVSLSSSAVPASGVGVYDLSASAVVFSTGLASNYTITYATNANGLTVTPRPVTVTAAAQSRIYGDGNPVLTYVTTSLGAGAALSGNLSTAATATSNVGDYAITAGGVTTAANPNYIVSYAGNNLTIGQRPVTVTADSQTRIYGDANSALTYVTTSLGAGAALSGNLATAATAASDVGDYAISAGGVTAAANPNYAISYVGGNLTVLQRSVTVTADAQSRVYGDANPLLTYSTTSLGAGKALTGTLATADVTANVGNYAITRGSLTDAANANYAVTYVGNTLTIGQRALTITADAQSRVYADTNPANGTATGNNLRNGDSVASVNLSSSATVISNVGSYDLIASAVSFSQGLASNYTIAYATRIGGLTVRPRPLTVTADAQSRIYGDTNPALTYVVGGLVNGDTLAGAPTTAAVATSNVGAYAISQGTLGNSNYAIHYVGANLSVTPRPLTVTADAQSRIYGDANPATGRAAGNNLVNGDSIASVSLTSPATPASNVGSYDLTGSAATFGSGLASNYAITYSTRANGLAVIARPLTVTADDQFRFQGFANPALTYRIGGGGLVNGDVLAGGLATSADTQSIAGSYDITRGTLAAGANYKLTYQGAVLTVLPSPSEAVLLASSIVRDNFDAVALPDDAKPVFGAPTVPTPLGLGVFYADARFDKVFVCFGGSGSCFVIGN